MLPRGASAEGPSSEGDGAEPKKTAAQAAAEVHYKRAKELYQLGRYREAIAQLEAALKLDPHGAELLYNLGLVHEKLGDADEAIDAYQRYLKVLGPDADPEEEKKIRGVIKRLQGAKDELKAREAKRMEHRFTPISVGLISVGAAMLVTGFVFGGLALKDDKSAQGFLAGSGGTIGDRDALIAKSKREAVFADVFVIGGAAAAAAGVTLYFLSEYPKSLDEPGDGKLPAPKGGASLKIAPLVSAGGGATMRFEVVF